MQNTDLLVRPWADYELLDSGNNKKLERFGAVIVIRPETQALWKPLRPELWATAAAEFSFGNGKGTWKKRVNIPESWDLAWQDIRFTSRLTSFKHTGVFPEQAVNWEWLADKVSSLKDPQVLNLFGYTGIASLVAVKHGAQVTHVDASKQSNAWAKENAKLSGVLPTDIRYILDDALKFAEREVRRNASYDGIVLDPPAFGRGAKNEVWKIEESLAQLLVALTHLLSKKSGSFLLLNGYAAGYSPLSFLQAVESFFEDAKGEFGELRIAESGGDRCIPSGVYVRFVR
jgi:23S rRNA (cytosine1962-C5)-methyltransferase